MEIDSSQTYRKDNFEGVIRSATSLARRRERLPRISDEAGLSLPREYEHITVSDTEK